jgi:hypothetical protein
MWYRAPLLEFRTVLVDRLRAFSTSWPAILWSGFRDRISQSRPTGRPGLDPTEGTITRVVQDRLEGGETFRRSSTIKMLWASASTSHLQGNTRILTFGCNRLEAPPAGRSELASPSN